jgi:hypothetical protein
MKQKLKFFGALSVILGVSGSTLYGLHKLIGPPQSYVSARFPPTSN